MTEMTVGEILRLLGGLRPGQLWTLIGVIVTVLTAAAGVGAKFANVTQSADIPKPCDEVSGYPLGEWLVSGRITQAGPDEPAGLRQRIADKLIFGTPQTGWVETDEPGAKQATFALDRPLKSGDNVTMTDKDSTGFESHFYGLVSKGGCMIVGTFDTSKGTKGYSSLIWKRDQYWVKP